MSRRRRVVKKILVTSARNALQFDEQGSKSSESEEVIRRRRTEDGRRAREKVRHRNESAGDGSSIRAALHAWAPQPSFVIPIFALSSSLTVCGLAFPPEDFMTWPTNQPIIAGFVLPCATF